MKSNSLDLIAKQTVFNNQHNKLKNGNNPPKNAVTVTIEQKRNEEYLRRGDKRKTVRVHRIKRTIDPILYLPAFSRGRHRLVKWRTHWLPSYLLKACRCGELAASRKHYQKCPLLTQLLNKLLEEFGNILVLQQNIHLIDYIMNKLPHSEVGL